MKKSRYFAELMENYSAEIDDLVSDSEGKPVLQKRLAIKRQELPVILPMIAFSPEMVAVAFYDAFSVKSPQRLQTLVLSEPWQAGFLSWSKLVKHLSIAAWALPLIDLTLASEGGEVFLVSTVGLEYLRTHDSADVPPVEGSDEEGDVDDGDLREQGAAWMTEQGFDSLDN